MSHPLPSSPSTGKPLTQRRFLTVAGVVAVLAGAVLGGAGALAHILGC
jgi:hypothetical protein